MGEAKTLVTLVLGGMFDHNELGDIDIIYESPAAEALQQELVTSVDDVHVELVSRLDYDALMQRNFELVAEAESLRKDAERYRKVRDCEELLILDQRVDDYIECLDSVSDDSLDAIVNSLIEKDSQ